MSRSALRFYMKFAHFYNDFAFSLSTFGFLSKSFLSLSFCNFNVLSSILKIKSFSRSFDSTSSTYLSNLSSDFLICCITLLCSSKLSALLSNLSWISSWFCISDLWKGFASSSDSQSISKRSLWTLKLVTSIGVHSISVSEISSLFGVLSSFVEFIDLFSF